MAESAAGFGVALPDRELACAPLASELGQRYLGAMRAAVNCALANRQILTHLVRLNFQEICPAARMPVLYDVSHNTCKLESHRIDGEMRALYVHRKGATRAFGPGHPDLPHAFQLAGQPVLVGGSMGTGSYLLDRTRESESLAFSSACHGAGRAMRRHQAMTEPAVSWLFSLVVAAMATAVRTSWPPPSPCAQSISTMRVEGLSLWRQRGGEGLPGRQDKPRLGSVCVTARQARH